MPELTIGVSGRVADSHVGGNTTYVRRVYEHLAAIGVRGSILRPSFPNSLRPKSRSLAYLAFEASWAEREAARSGLDALHFPADTGPVLSLGRLPLVVTVHGVAALHVPGIRGRAATQVWMARTRRAARCASVVITVSESSARDVRQLAFPHRLRVEVIPHGVDHQKFLPATPSELVGARAHHALERPYALFVGNLEPRKNLAAVIAAVETLNSRGTDLELIVAGKPAWRPDGTLAAISRSDNVRQIGWVEDDELRGLMSGSRVFVFPSLYEGFGLPVLEAMACGAPVVCTRRGFLPEVGGGAPVYAADTDADSLCAAIQSCLDLPRDILAERGIARAAEYHWQFSAAGHLRVFASIV